MHIGILAPGITPDELIKEHGTYAFMLQKLLLSSGHDFTFEVYDVLKGEFPTSPDLCDGWLITGSKYSVYDDMPWIAPLKAFILEIDAAQKPLVGICFGHQIIAEAFDGKVERYHGGWGVGIHQYVLQGHYNFIPEAAGSIVLNAMHQDQVKIKPEKAEVLATSEFCPYAGLIYHNRILTLQAHPEFGIGFEQELIKLRKGSVIPNDVADTALDGLSSNTAKTDSQLVAKWLGDFYQSFER